MSLLLVEEYLNTEASPEVLQALVEDGETALLIEKLGLKGQSELYKPHEDGQFNIHPYREISAEELVVFSTMFPEKCSVENFKTSPIPLRVLQIIEHVRSLNLPDMAYLEVWAPKPGKVDPILVARKTYYQSPIFLLARWGSALEPFVALKAKAVKQIAQKYRSQLEDAKNIIAQRLLNIDAHVMANTNEGKETSLYITGL